jgi:hypothetical protein
MHSYRFVCEKENWQASWAVIAKHYYGRSFVPTTPYLANCKQNISKTLKVELDDVIVYIGETPIL